METLKDLLFTHKHIFDEIFTSCGNNFTQGCGSYLFDGKNYTYCLEMYDKQNLLYTTTKDCSTVLEVGTYMGHSSLIMLLSNPKLHITTIDIDDTFPIPSINVLKKYFGERIEFIKGNSIDVLKTLNKKFDFFHIDGSHNENVILEELNLCLNLSSSNEIKIIFDDIDSMPNTKNYILNNFKVTQHIKPNCIWPNCLIKIEI